MNAHAFVAALGWTLLDFLWQGALIGVETALALFALRRARPEARYLALCLGLLACVAWPAVSLVPRLGEAAGGGAFGTLAGMPAAAAPGAGWEGLVRAHLAWIVLGWAACAGALGLRMAADLLEALLAHELAHVKRHDYLVNLCQNVAETLLFYHPIVWWLSRRIQVEREQIADDIAARTLGEPRRLALALSELEKLQFSTHHLAQAANGGDLMSRIKRLLRPDAKASNWKAAIPALGLAALSVAVFAHAAPAAPSKADTTAIADFASCARPHYPEQELRQNHEGTVTMHFRVGADGRVKESKLSQSSGYPALDDAAHSALVKCRFYPARTAGKPVQDWTQVKYVWVSK